MDEYTTVPVLVGFNHEKVIGQLCILTSALPPQPDFVFALAVECKGGPPGTIVTAPPQAPYKLLSVAPVLDLAYIGYLRQVGLIKG